MYEQTLYSDFKKGGVYFCQPGGYTCLCLDNTWDEGGKMGVVTLFVIDGDGINYREGSIVKQAYGRMNFDFGSWKRVV